MMPYLDVYIILVNISNMQLRIWRERININFNSYQLQYAISQLRIVRSGLHLVNYLDVGNFCNKSADTNLHEVCVQVKFF